MRDLIPNSYNYVSVSDLYISTIGLHTLLQQNRWTDRGNIWYISRSHIHECGFWERGRAVSFLGIHISDLVHSILPFINFPSFQSPFSCTPFSIPFLSSSSIFPILVFEPFPVLTLPTLSVPLFASPLPSSYLRLIPLLSCSFFSTALPPPPSSNNIHRFFHCTSLSRLSLLLSLCSLHLHKPPPPPPSTSTCLFTWLNTFNFNFKKMTSSILIFR